MMEGKETGSFVLNTALKIKFPSCFTANRTEREDNYREPNDWDLHQIGHLFCQLVAELMNDRGSPDQNELWKEEGSKY